MEKRLRLLRRAGFLAAFVGFAGLGVHRFAGPLPDWTVRCAGCFLLVAIVLLSYSTAAVFRAKREK